MKHIIKPVVTAGLAAVLYFIATNVGAGWLYVVAAILGATLLVSIPIPAWTIAGIQVKREAPPVGIAGTPMESVLEVRNAGRLPRHLVELSDKYAGGEGGAVTMRINGKAAVKLKYLIEKPHRGIYSGGQVSISSGAPFGLFYGIRRKWVSSRTVIYPRTFAVDGVWAGMELHTSTSSSSEEAAPHRGLGGEFWGVREYRPGDPARLIAWRRSAHAGHLTVTELANHTLPPFSVALQLDPDTPERTHEGIISIAASLVLQALKEGREVMADAGPQQSSFPQERDPERILTWFATLKPARPPDSPKASVTVIAALRGTRAPDSSMVILVSSSGNGPWMAAREEQNLIREIESNGGRVVVIREDVEHKLGAGSA